MRRSTDLAKLHWCDRCNVPLIGPSCGKCGEPGREVPLSPPGDVRLALDGTKRRLRYLFLREYGVQQLIPDVVVLNKTSGEDRAEEVIVNGRRIALLRYDLARRKHEVVLRLDGARMLAALGSRKRIVLKKADGHMKGKYLPPEAIASFDDGIRAGDEVVIQMGQFVGCGSAKVDAHSLLHSDKGVKVRDFAKVGPLPPRGKKVWTKALIRANLPHLVAKKTRAEHELREVVGSHPLPLTVSFSGGKDSLVVLDLVQSVTHDFVALFIDTGLEHPLTREYIDRLASERSVRVLKAHAGDAFDRNMPSFGPPAKDFRWCCKVCKLAPVSALIQERYPKGTVTVEGNRRLESFSRGHTELVEENPFVPGQVTVNLIRNWTGLDVWLYIIWRKLKYNPLYDEDIERVGCWMCPSALASEAEEITRISPDLARAWQAKLMEWAERNRLSKEYVTHGFWRWKELPPKMRELAQRLEMDVTPVRVDTLDLKVLKGVSPCTAGGYSVEAVLSTESPADLARVCEMLKVIGDARHSEEFGVAMADNGKDRLRVFAGGQMTATAGTPDDASRLFSDGARAVLRAALCTKCGICVKSCPKGAVRMEDRIAIQEEKCARCGTCVEACVVAHYFDKLAGQVRPDKKAARTKRRARA
jgi:phosphoadenosine phosphosulfate reductase